MSAEYSVELDGGKYTVRHTSGGNFHALRYGEPWRDLTGDGLILSLVQRIEELEAGRIEAHERAVPFAYAYRHSDGFVRFSAASVNGGSITETIPLFTRPLAQPAQEQGDEVLGEDKGSPDGDCTVRGRRLKNGVVEITSVEYTPPAQEQPGLNGDTGNADADRVIGRLMSSDPNFDDCESAAILIRRLVCESEGPRGYATWKDAAIAERLLRVKAEKSKGDD